MLSRTVLIVTPSRDLANLLADALSEAGYGAQVSEDRQTALRLADECVVDCVLIDWDAGEAFGRRLMSDLAAWGPAVPKIILSSSENLRSAVLAFKTGASDLLEKPLSPGDLRPAIDEAITRTARSTQLARDIAGARRALAGLSEREQQMVAGIVAGLTSREIADAVGISVRTVETSRTRLLGKVGVPNTAALVRLAVLAGLTSLAREPVEA